ncbi:MAG: glycosyltransferase family protein [Elusimicrobia bacterium]|nr:glycosyltransferase family protein [Elusimicrobiota bacterium]
MRRVFIVQARMTSTRLPGKVLMDLAGRPMLAQQIRRLKRCRTADEIVLATTVNAADDPVAALARAESVGCFRGDEADVLGRYWKAATNCRADIVVRLTADCPLIDPEQSDRVVRELETQGANADYASNVIERTFPRGLDTEAFTMDALERVHRAAASRPSREHVTYFILKEQRAQFRILSVKDAEDNSGLRWTVDVPEDLEMMRRIYEGLMLSERNAGYREILTYVRAHPEITALNAGVAQKKV